MRDTAHILNHQIFTDNINSRFAQLNIVENNDIMDSLRIDTCTLALLE